MIIFCRTSLLAIDYLNYANRVRLQTPVFMQGISSRILVTFKYKVFMFETFKAISNITNCSCFFNFYGLLKCSSNVRLKLFLCKIKLIIISSLNISYLNLKLNKTSG